MRLLLRLLTMFVLGACLGAVILVFRPPVPRTLATSRNPKLDAEDMAETISQVVIKQAGKQFLGEADINAFFTQVLASRQAAPFGRIATPAHVSCDLEAGVATLEFGWKLFHNLHLQTSLDLKVERRGPDLACEILSGSYGRLRVPRALLTPLKPALLTLADSCGPELTALTTLPKLSIAKDKLVLDPSF